MTHTTDRPGEAPGVRHMTDSGHVIHLRTVPSRPAPPTTPDRLGDGALLVAIRDTIAAARIRPRLRAELRKLLADELIEMKAELLAASGATPEEILIASYVAAEPAARVAAEPHDCQGERLARAHDPFRPSA